MVLLSTLYIGLRVDDANLNPPGDGPSRGGDLTLVDPSVSILDKLYLKNPVEGSLPIENIEPVVCGESDEPIGEDMPVSDSDPGDQRITDGSVPGVLHGTVQKGGVLSLDGDVDRVAV